MSQPAEIELKLEVPAGEVVRLRRLPLLKTAKPQTTKTLRSVYFDTDRQKLRKHGLSLRVRHRDGHHVQTIKKRGGRSVGLFKRSEWEREIDGRQPNLDAAHGTALEPLAGKKLRRGLKPVFETRVRRIVYPIHRNGSEIELAIDKGKVEAAGRSSPLCEVELELKKGQPQALFDLARALDKVAPVQLASKSKAEHGYALIGKKQPGPVKSEPIEIEAEADWAAAFKIVARACLYLIVANTFAIRQQNLKAVHQMRVGVRKLRAAISLFRDMLAGPQTAAMKSELKWITEELGPARELDVFVKRVKQVQERGPKGPGMDAIARDFRERRTAALARATQAIASARFRRLILDATAWVEIGDWTRNGNQSARTLRKRQVARAAAAELRRRSKKIRKQGARLAELDARTRHKLRIKAKKLRYGCEFFASVFAGKKTRRQREKFIARLKTLQDALGELNDITVHEGLAKRTLNSAGAAKRPRRAKKAFAAGRLSGREEARFAPVLQAAVRAHKDFAKAKPFWT